MKTMNALMTLTALTLTMSPAFSGSGDKVGGGGDTKTEARIHFIRNNILEWIHDGGGASLVLSQDISYDAYASKMTEILAPHAVVITAMTTEELQAEELRNPGTENTTKVDGRYKTCRGYRSEMDGRLNILCNSDRFARGMTESDQFELIHHEYAGLAGLEKNDGASSDYGISKQITTSLEPKVVLQLVVKPKKDPLPPGVYEYPVIHTYNSGEGKVVIAFSKYDFDHVFGFFMSQNKVDQEQADLFCFFQSKYGRGQHGRRASKYSTSEILVKDLIARWPEYKDRRTNLFIYTTSLGEPDLDWLNAPLPSNSDDDTIRIFSSITCEE